MLKRKPSAIVHFFERAMPLTVPVVGLVAASTSMAGLSAATQTLGSALFVTAFVSEFFYLVVSIYELLNRVQSANEFVYQPKKGKVKGASIWLKEEALFIPILKTTTHALSLFIVMGGLAYAIATGQTMLSLMPTVMPVFLSVKVVSLMVELIKDWKDYSSTARLKVQINGVKIKHTLTLNVIKTILCLSLAAVTVGVAMMETCPELLAASSALLCVMALLNLVLRQVAFHPKNKRKCTEFFARCAKKRLSLSRKNSIATEISAFH